MTEKLPKDLRSGLAAAYEAAHDHLRYILKAITPEQATKEPTPKSRTILYYLHHLINTELYWLAATGRKVEQYPKAISFDAAIGLLSKVKERILEELKNCPKNELQFVPPTEKSDPSLGWVVNRITIHTLYHTGEILYARYAVGGFDLPNDELEESWGRMINSVAHLVFFVKQ